MNLLLGMLLRWTELLYDMAFACVKSSAANKDAIIQCFDIWIHSGLVSKFLVTCVHEVNPGGPRRLEDEAIFSREDFMLLSKSLEVILLY